MAASSIFTGSGTTSTMSLTVRVTGATGESLSFFAGRAWLRAASLGAGGGGRRGTCGRAAAPCGCPARARRGSPLLGGGHPARSPPGGPALTACCGAGGRGGRRGRRRAAGAAAAVGAGFATGETDGRVTFGTAGISTGRGLPFPFPLPLPRAGAEAAESLPRPVRTGAAGLARARLCVCTSASGAPPYGARDLHAVRRGPGRRWPPPRGRRAPPPRARAGAILKSPVMCRRGRLRW